MWDFIFFFCSSIIFFGEIETAALLPGVSNPRHSKEGGTGIKIQKEKETNIFRFQWLIKWKKSKNQINVNYRYELTYKKLEIVES